MQPNQEMNLVRRNWTIAAPADDLADRILAHAFAQPQRKSWLAQWHDFVDSFAKPGPSRGFAFAACLVIAVIAFDPQPQNSKPLKSSTMEKYVEQLIWDDYQY